MMTSTSISNLDEMHQFGCSLFTQIRKHSLPPCILLSGDLGTGKTTLTQYIGTEMEVDTPITSPTYTLRNTYSTKRSDYPFLIHMDLYRLQAAWEIHELDLLQDRESAITIVEWPEKASDIWQTIPHIWLTLEAPSPSERIIYTSTN